MGISPFNFKLETFVICWLLLKSYRFVHRHINFTLSRNMNLQDLNMHKTIWHTWLNKNESSSEDTLQQPNILKFF